MQVFVRSFVCLFVFLLIRVSLCFLAWLVVSMCACVFVGHLAAQFRGLLALLGTCLCFSCTLGALGLHCNTWGSFLRPPGRILGLNLLILALRLATRGIHSDYFHTSGEGPWTIFSIYLEKV